MYNIIRYVLKYKHICGHGHIITFGHMHERVSKNGQQSLTSSKGLEWGGEMV